MMDERRAAKLPAFMYPPLVVTRPPVGMWMTSTCLVFCGMYRADNSAGQPFDLDIEYHTTMAESQTCP